MFRVIACAVSILAGCAYEPPKPTVVTKTIVQTVNTSCPSEDEIRDIAIAASRDTYSKAPGGRRTCPCRRDTYEKGGVKLECGDQSAEAKTKWVLCRREQVSAALVAELKGKIPACRGKT